VKQTVGIQRWINNWFIKPWKENVSVHRAGVFSYFKRQAEAICISLVLSPFAPPACIRAGHFKSSSHRVRWFHDRIVRNMAKEHFPF
jgi:hypothetical protein